MVENIGDVLCLVRGTRLNHAAFGFDVDGFAIVRHAFRALLKHARLFDGQVDLFRFNILDLTAHRGGINIQAAENICRGVDADWASGEFEMVIATIDFDTQTSLQLFDVVIKRPAQAQQASVVCGLKANFTRIYVQTVPLYLVN